MPLWVRPKRKLTRAVVHAMLSSHYEGSWLDPATDVGAGAEHSPYRFNGLSWQHKNKDYVNERLVHPAHLMRTLACAPCAPGTLAPTCRPARPVRPIYAVLHSGLHLNQIGLICFVRGSVVGTQFTAWHYVASVRSAAPPALRALVWWGYEQGSEFEID